jgi:hypothetical protein
MIEKDKNYTMLIWWIKTVIWAIIFAALIILCSCMQSTTRPLKGRMTNHQVRDAQNGITYYTRMNGKMYKNTHKIQQYEKRK